jgi:hypothetical protein
VKLNFKVVVAKLADGHKSTVVEVLKNMGLSSCNWKMGHIMQGGVCGSDDGAVWELDVDTIIGGTTIYAVTVNF